MNRCTIAGCAAVLAVAACGGGSTSPDTRDAPGDPAVLVLSADTVTFTAIGQVYPLTATVSDANGIALGGATVTWSSADDAVATVDGSGRIEATGVGQTRVTAFAGDASDTATVAVTQTAASISVVPVLSELHALGDSVVFTATVRDANGNVIAGAVVDWSSADEAVATVDAAGWVTARANGATTVTASAANVSDEAAVVVAQIVASVGVSPATDTLTQHGTTALTATVADANGAAVLGKPVIWTTSDPTLATVDNSGTVMANGWGADAVITATVEGVSGSASVHLLDQIAFTSYRDGNNEIYIMNADGSGATNLTNNGGDDHDPVWSPDGSRVAFESTRDGGNYEIYVMNADGSGQTNLSNNAALDYMPSWSPDGSRIAFTSSRDGNSEIYVMNADGSGPTNLTNNGAAEGFAAWSPDGSRIAFASNRDGNYEIYVMNVDGSGLTNLTNNGGDDDGPGWSPDGSRIAFTSYRDGNYEIYVMNADGSGQTNLSNNGAIDFLPAWSPDGSRIAFTSSRDGNQEIYVMNADGSGPTNLTNNGASDAIAAWSPDGSRVAFTSTRDGGWEIYVVNADGSGLTNLSNARTGDDVGAWRPGS